MHMIPSGPRYRERGNTATDPAISWRGIQCNGVVQPISYGKTHRYGVVEGMSDVVTPHFRDLIAKGTIINSPMTRVSQRFEGGGRGSTTRWSGCTAGTSTSIATIDCISEIRNQLSYRYNEVRDASGRLTCKPSIVDLASIQRHVNTKALAGVDDSTFQTMISIGELGQTIAMFKNPISALTTYTKRWKASKDWKKAMLSGAPGAIADQYLMYYYGIKPTISDIENALEAWLNEGIKKPRRTSRASATDQKSSTTIQGGNPGTGFAWDMIEVMFKEEVTVRAGILYDVEHLGSKSAQYGLRLSDAPSALWDLTPWSFFFDYFMNLNDIIAALSPRVGVNYLACWDTVKLIQTDSWQVIAGGTNQSNTTRTPSSEWAKRVIETTIRSPKSPYDNIGFSAQRASKMFNWSVQKDLAVVSLAIQQLANYHRW